MAGKRLSDTKVLAEQPLRGSTYYPPDPRRGWNPPWSPEGASVRAMDNPGKFRRETGVGCESAGEALDELTRS